MPMKKLPTHDNHIKMKKIKINQCLKSARFHLKADTKTSKVKPAKIDNKRIKIIMRNNLKQEFPYVYGKSIMFIVQCTRELPKVSCHSISDGRKKVELHKNLSIKIYQ